MWIRLGGFSTSPRPQRPFLLNALAVVCFSCSLAGAARQPVPLPLAERPLEPQHAALLAPQPLPASSSASASWDSASDATTTPLVEPNKIISAGVPRSRGDLHLTDVVLPLAADGSQAPVLAPVPVPVVEAAAGAASATTTVAATATASAAASAPPPPSADGHRHHQHHIRPPPPPPRPRERPLWGNIATLGDLGSVYVRSHVGLEAAAALLLAGLLSFWALCYVCSAFCGYSLCCLGRGKHSTAPRSPRKR